MDSRRYIWDPHSEQPYPVRHRVRHLDRLRCSFFDYVKSIGVFLCCLPFVLGYQTALSNGYRSSNWTRPQRRSAEFMGLAVALQSCDGPRQAAEIKALGVNKILLRIPLWDIADLEKYAAFIDSLPECEFAICVMQDWNHILDTALWRSNLSAIARRFWPRVRQFQIGQGMNRSKWGFASTGDFLSFASIAEELRETYPSIELVGPGILDFEPIALLRALVHGHRIRWDAVGCALYVDRRGSPRKRQLLLFNLTQKIYHFAACMRCSSKARRRFWITEVNWPITGQGPYSPTGETECVTEEQAATYLTDYYNDAWKTQLVERVYWWQLVAKGFGLIDIEADGSLRKRPAYYAFSKLLREGFKSNPEDEVLEAAAELAEETSMIKAPASSPPRQA